MTFWKKTDWKERLWKDFEESFKKKIVKKDFETIIVNKKKYYERDIERQIKTEWLKEKDCR